VRTTRERKLFGPLVVGAFVAAWGFVRYRRYHLRWGATDAEVQGLLPGDDLIASPSFTVTRAITIDATPAQVWPWIVQIGNGRAGFYSYDLLDNLGRRSAERILPQWQAIEVGGLAAPMSPFEHPPTPATAFVVAGFETNHWLLWSQKRSSWVWSLEPIAADRTRLITRVRCAYNWPHPLALFSLLLMEIGDFPMMRKQLIGIKRRAENPVDPPVEPSIRSSESTRITSGAA